MSKGILVLGMHRSGTSTISGSLSKLGVNLGKRLIKPQKNVNEKGFYEAGPVLNINNALLCHMGSYWDDFYPQQPIDFDDGKVTRLINQARDYIHSEFQSEVWALKEPRISILMPFWQKVFEPLANQISVLYIFRHPEEVCGSLAKRDHFGRDKSYLLWIKYNLDAELYSRNRPRYFMEYNDLFNRFEKVVEQMQAALDVTFPLTYQQAKSALDDFVTTGLRNNVAKNLDPEQENSEAARLGLEMYQLLLKLKNDQSLDVASAFDSFRQRYLAIFAALPEYVIEHHRELGKERGRYENLFLESYNTHWWKLSSPFRWMEKKWRVID